MALSSSQLCALLAFLWSAESAPLDRRALDRRVVDRAQAGDTNNESTHGYVGVDVDTGIADGKAFRQARGWMRYAMTVFDDTEVTIACVFVGSEGATLRYDLVVEDSVVASRSYSSPTASPTVVEIQVPLSITKGRTNIAVTIRANGGLTPALRELRTMQDHNEDVTSSRSQNPSGAVR